MAQSKQKWCILAACCVAGLLGACGGGGDAPASATPAQLAPFSGGSTTVPVASGATAQDGWNWIQYRRAQSGLQSLTGNAQLTTAAQNHSDYQKFNHVVSHVQVAGLPGFLGVSVAARLLAVGYIAPATGFAYGEVIAAAGERSGFVLAEHLLAAIYHRFVLLSPSYKEGGAGAATNADGYTYFSADLTAKDGYAPGLAPGGIVTYPFANQDQVAVNFFSDTEIPDPIPRQNEVGYPISAHVNLDAMLTVETFTVRPRGGATLPAQLLTSSSDPETPMSAAAIIPLAPLQNATIYDVALVGAINGVPLVYNWSFLTQ